MPMRKWLALALSVSSVALISAGLSVADAQDEEGEETLEDLMTEVSSTNNRINRAIRSPVTFRKSQSEIVEYAKTLADLGKKAREAEEGWEGVEDVENPKETWQQLMDEFITTSEETAAAAEEGDQTKAKDAHLAVKKACAECHKVFRVEDDF